MCDALLQSGDPDSIAQLVANAKQEIDACTYDKSLTLEENRSKVYAIYEKLLQNVQEIRNKQNTPAITSGMAQTGDANLIAIYSLVSIILVACTLVSARQIKKSRSASSAKHSSK